jgi:hypothetical protein
VVCKSQPWQEIWEAFSPMKFRMKFRPRFRADLYTVMNGYIDESGNEDIFCLSCLIGKGSNWGFFQGDWDDVIAKKNKSLKAQGRQLISRYHAADCSSRVGEFKGWTTDEQIELTKELLKVFEKPSNSLTVVAFTLDLRELVELIPETAPDPTGFAYALLIRCLMGEIGDLLVKANGAAAAFKIPLIHERCLYDAVLLRSFNNMNADSGFKYPKLFPSLVPMGWEDCPPLQATDLLAYENFKEHERRLKGKPARRRTLDELLKRKGFGGLSKGFNREAILSMRNILTEDVRQQILLEANIRKTAKPQ